MQSARLFVAVSALALGLSHMATVSVRADANAHHVPAGMQTRWRAYDGGEVKTCPVDATTLALDLPESVYVDPTTGSEIYLPTGETIDHVLPVVATRLPAPAVASVQAAPPSAEESCESCTWLYYSGATGLLLALGLFGRFVVRRKLAAQARNSSSSIHTGLVL